MPPVIGVALPEFLYGSLLYSGDGTSNVLWKSNNLTFARASAGVYNVGVADPILNAIPAVDGRLQMRVAAQYAIDTTGLLGAIGTNWIQTGTAGLWQFRTYVQSVVAGALTGTLTDLPFWGAIYTTEKNYASTGP